jgi:hypothetical protein
MPMRRLLYKPRTFFVLALGYRYTGTIAVTTPIATAFKFKFCIRHRKSGLLNR